MSQITGRVVGAINVADLQREIDELKEQAAELFDITGNLNLSLKAEISSRISEAEKLLFKITTETTERKDDVALLKSRISTLSAAIKDETARAMAAEAQLDHDVEAETERAINAETALDNRVTAIEANYVTTNTEQTITAPKTFTGIFTVDNLNSGAGIEVSDALYLSGNKEVSGSSTFFDTSLFKDTVTLDTSLDNDNIINVNGSDGEYNFLAYAEDGGRDAYYLDLNHVDNINSFPTFKTDQYVVSFPEQSGTLLTDTGADLYGNFNFTLETDSESYGLHFDTAYTNDGFWIYTDNLGLNIQSETGNQDILLSGQDIKISGGAYYNNVEIATVDDVSAEEARAIEEESQLQDNIDYETSLREAADDNLQDQIDAIESKADVVDVVATKALLNGYDTSTLTDKDVVKVLTDESRGDATTYYRWVIVSGVGAWSYIGSIAGYVTLHGAQTIDGVKTFTANTTYAGSSYINFTSPQDTISATISLNKHPTLLNSTESLKASVSGEDADSNEYSYRADLGGKGFTVDTDLNQQSKSIFHVDDGYLYTNAGGIDYGGSHDGTGWEQNTEYLEFPQYGGTIATQEYVADYINDLDVAEVGEDGSYIKKVSETNGKVSITKQAFDTLMTSANDNAPTSKAVRNYIDSVISGLDVQTLSPQLGRGKTITDLGENNGKIFASAENIEITSSQISDVQDTYSGTDGKAISGKGVKAAIETLDITDITNTAGKTVSRITETDGKVGATFQDISIASSQISDKTNLYDASGEVAVTGKAITNAFGTLKVNEVGSDGGYIKTISETDGKISASRQAFDTIISASSTDNNVPTSKAVWKLVDDLPEPMVFKGSVGDSGTVSWANLPSAASSNEGFTYKVITAHATAPICKVGDTIISNGSEWVVIPSGDEPSGTVTSVGLSMPTGFTVTNSPVTSSGTLTATLDSGYSLLNSNSDQTIAGNKTFSGNNTFSGTQTITNQVPSGNNVGKLGSEGAKYSEIHSKNICLNGGTYKIYYDDSTIKVSSDFVPSASGKNLGSGDLKWNNIYVSNLLTDGTNSVTVAGIASKEDSSNKVTSISASSTDTEYPSALATHTAITNAINDLDVSNITANLGRGKTLTALSESNGKISATAETIQITSSQITDKTNTYDGTSEVVVTGKAVKAAIDDLNVSDITANLGKGKTLTALSESGGKISATAENIEIISSQISDIQDTYSGTDGKAISGKGVKTAIDGLTDTLTGSPAASKTLTAFDEVGGKVTATFGDISITSSQISDKTNSYSATGEVAVTGKAIKAALDGLTATNQGGAGSYISAISESGGVITATPGTFDTSIPTSSQSETTAPTSKAVADYVANVGTIANATNVTTNINGHAISDIFESNGTTVKVATTAGNLTSHTLRYDIGQISGGIVTVFDPTHQDMKAPGGTYAVSYYAEGQTWVSFGMVIAFYDGISGETFSSVATYNGHSYQAKFLYMNGTLTLIILCDGTKITTGIVSLIRLDFDLW